MAVLADGKARPQGGGGEPLPKLCGPEAAICHRALQQRDEPNLRRHELAAQGPRVSRRQLFHRRYRVRRLGEPSRAPRPRHERFCQCQTLARSFAGASGGQTWSVGQGGSGLSRRHERSEGARNSVQSESALIRRTYAARPTIEVLDGARRGRYGGSVAGDVAEWLKAAVC